MSNHVAHTSQLATRNPALSQCGKPFFRGLRVEGSQLAILSVTLLAFALRVYQLDAMSFWSDEGISVIRAHADIPSLLANLPIEHNPLYFVGLHYWMQLAGEGDFAVRFFSLFFSVLLIPIVYKLGVAICALPQRSGALALASDERTNLPFAIRNPQSAIGLLAALFAAINPLQIWYAQEARMYSLVVALCAGAAWCLLRGFLILDFRQRSGALALQMVDVPLSSYIQASTNPQFAIRNSQLAIGYWLSFALLSVAALYTHFFAALVVGAMGLWALFVVIGNWRQRSGALALVISDWKTLRPLFVSLVVMVVLLVPWFPRAMASLSFPGWQEAADPLSLPLRYWLAYTVGSTMSVDYLWLSLVFLGLFIIGSLALLRHPHTLHQLPITNYYLPLFYVLIPFSAIMLLALRKPGYHERYLIVITPMLFIIWGVGLDMLRVAWAVLPSAQLTARSSQFAIRIAFYFLLFICLLASALSLYNLYFDPNYGKADFRGAAQYIDRQTRAGDGLIFDGPDPNKAFYRYFSRQRVTTFDETNFDTRDLAAATQFLSARAPQHERWWVVLYFHPPGPTEEWLARYGYQTSSRWFNGIRVLLYATPNEATFAALQPQAPQRVEAKIPLQIADVRLPARIQAGDVLPLVVNWRVDGALTADYQVSLRLADDNGKTIKQLDRRPLDGRMPTSQWRVGETITDRYGLLVPADVPTGTYHIELIMYLLNGGEVLRARVGKVEVIP